MVWNQSVGIRSMSILRKLAILLFSPRTAWQAIAQERRPIWQLYLGWLLPLTLLMMLAVLASQLFHGGGASWQQPLALVPPLVSVLWGALGLALQLTAAATSSSPCSCAASCCSPATCIRRAC